MRRAATERGRGGRATASSSGLRSAVGLLCVVGGPARPSAGAVAWFGPVGATLGATLGAAWWALRLGLPPTVAAAVVVALDLGLTGMLHFDGLVDAADGLVPHLSREKRLAVMAEPTVGAFGVLAGAMALVLRVVALSSIRGPGLAASVLLLGGLALLSRSVMGFVVARLDYAPGGGGFPERFGAVTAGRDEQERVPAWPAVAGGLLALAALVAYGPSAGAAAWAAALVGSGVVVWLARRRLGGYTGDVLGAAGVLGETLGLVLAAAKW